MLTLIILALVVYFVFYQLSYQSLQPATNLENFCPHHCPEDDKAFKKYHRNLNTKYPCYRNMQQLGYDNPYIYPYNHFMRLTEGIGYYKYPEWVRYMSSIKEDKTFPGYIH